MGKSVRTFKKGDLIFAKMKGYPYWPARIETTAKELIAKKKYNILFYGTHDTSVLKVDQLIPYNEETRQTHGQKRRMSTFNDALWEIESDPKMKRKPSSGADSNKKQPDNTKAQNGYKAANGRDHSQDLDSSVGSSQQDDLEVSHEDGLLSYERFCKYIAQFECTTTDQIQSVKDIYKNISSQYLAKVVKEVTFGNGTDQIDATTDSQESNGDELAEFDVKIDQEVAEEVKKLEEAVVMASEPSEPTESNVLSKEVVEPTAENELPPAAVEAMVEQPLVAVSSIDVSELISNGVGLSGNGIPEDGANLLEVNMAISDDLTDQNIVDMVKEGVEVEEAFKSTN